METDPKLRKDQLLEIAHAEFMKNGIAGQHISTFNEFITDGAKKIVTTSFGSIGKKDIENKRSVTDEDKSIKSISFNVAITDWKFGKPEEINVKTGEAIILTPNSARIGNKNYSSPCTMSVKITASATKHDGTIIEHNPVEILDYPIGNLPIMVGCCKCHTYNMTKTELKGINEDIDDPQGYFILHGGERVLDALENVAFNVPQIHKNFYMNEIVRCEFISKYGVGFENSSQIRIKILKGGALTLEIVIAKLKEINIPFYLIYRIFGMTRDYDIIKTIVYDIENKSNNEITKQMIKVITEAMRVSIKKGKKSTETDDQSSNIDNLNNDNNLDNKESDNKESENLNYDSDHDLGKDIQQEEDTSFNSVINEINVSKLLEEIWNKTSDNKLKKTENNQKYIHKQMLDLLDKHFLPHIGNNESYRHLKLLHFGNLIRQTLLVLLDVLPSTDRDSEKNKLVQAAGITYAKAFKTQFNINIYIHVTSALTKAFESKEFSKVDLADVYRKSMINSKDLETGMIKSMTSGTTSIKIGTKQITNRVSSKVMDRRNTLASIAIVRSISAPGGSASKQSERAEGIREVHPRYLGKICIIQTQEGGEGVGMNKQMAYSSSIVIATSPHKVIALLSAEPSCISTENIDLYELANYVDKSTYNIDKSANNKSFSNSNKSSNNSDKLIERNIKTGLTKIFVNGIWLTSTNKPNYILCKYRYLRRFNYINSKISIYKEENLNEIHFRTEAGRLTEPMIIVYNNLFEEKYNEKTGEFTEFDLSNVTKEQYNNFNQYIKLTHEHIVKLRKKQITIEDLRIEGVIEYIDVCEMDNHLYASNLGDFKQNKNNFYKQYTHLEIEQNLFGIPALTTPFINMSPPNRTAFQTSQSRQTCGQYSSEFAKRTDKNMFYQSICENPICGTIQYHKSNGINCVVAITTDNGYNQEDSQITKDAFLARCAFGGHYIHTIDNTLETGESFCKPNYTDTSGIKRHSSYELIGDDGLPKPGSIIRKGDVIIGKKATLNIPTQNFKYTDKSITHQNDEELRVLMSFRSYNYEGKEFAKVVTIAYRKMDTGDKTSARSGCKGINSHVMADCDMPYTEDGIIPDFIINPTTFPSRMVCNQIIEMIVSWVGIHYGVIIDCTSFKEFDLPQVLELLETLGLKSHGKRRMFDGRTGNFIDAEIYIGVTFYQRLQKFIKNDAHANNNAPINVTTHQPNKGVGKGGMIRFGEMEKDVIASHGSAHILSERWYHLSDGAKIPFCQNCGSQCIINEQYSYYNCKICGDNAKIGILNSSWTAKLFNEHTNALNVKTERIFDPIYFEELEGDDSKKGSDDKDYLIKGHDKSTLTKFNPKRDKISHKLRSVFETEQNIEIFNKLHKLRNVEPIITYDQIGGSIPYVEGTEPYTPTIHNGQVKLFLSELKESIDISIYNKQNHDLGSNNTPIIVYAGSSPCNKLYMLLKLFPDYKFVLVDPNETNIYVEYNDKFNRVSHYEKDTKNIIYFRSLLDNRYNVQNKKSITYLGENGPERIDRKTFTQDKHTPIDKAIDFIKNSDYRIFIFEDYMTCELSEQLSVLPNIHFWCDIRTNSGFSSGVTDVDLLWNLAQQYNWIKRLKPITFMLKFRCPFYDVSIDTLKQEFADTNKIYYDDIQLASDLNLIENYENRKLLYFNGIIELQQYPGKSSTETRLKGAPKYDKNEIINDLIYYDPREFENKFAYYNKTERWIVHRYNEYVNDKTIKIGYCHCNDCAGQSYIWELYNTNIKQINITEKILELSRVSGRGYKVNGHGDYVNGYTMEDYNKLLEKYKDSYRI